MLDSTRPARCAPSLSAWSSNRHGSRGSVGCAAAPSPISAARIRRCSGTWRGCWSTGACNASSSLDMTRRDRLMVALRQGNPSSVLNKAEVFSCSPEGVGEVVVGYQIPDRVGRSRVRLTEGPAKLSSRKPTKDPASKTLKVPANNKASSAGSSGVLLPRETCPDDLVDPRVPMSGMCRKYLVRKTRVC